MKLDAHDPNDLARVLSALDDLSLEFDLSINKIRNAPSSDTSRILRECCAEAAKFRNSSKTRWELISEYRSIARYDYLETLSHDFFSLIRKNTYSVSELIFIVNILEECRDRVNLAINGIRFCLE